MLDIEGDFEATAEDGDPSGYPAAIAQVLGMAPERVVLPPSWAPEVLPDGLVRMRMSLLEDAAVEDAPVASVALDGGFDVDADTGAHARILACCFVHAVGGAASGEHRHAMWCRKVFMNRAQ